MNTLDIDASNSGQARAPAWSSFVLALVGLAVSGYLAYERLTGSESLVCSDSGVINCLKVTTSQWSVILGVPVAVAGVAFFAAMTLLCLPISAIRPLHRLRIIFGAVGLPMVAWLIYVEVAKVHAICLWCTAAHAIALLLFVSVIWWSRASTD